MESFFDTFYFFINSLNWLLQSSFLFPSLKLTLLFPKITEVFNGTATNSNPNVGDRFYIKNVIILSTDGQDVSAVADDIARAKDVLIRQPNNAAGETEIIPITPTADFRPYVKLIVY